MSAKPNPSLEEQLDSIEKNMDVARARNDARGELLLRKGAKRRVEILRKIKEKDSNGTS